MRTTAATASGLIAGLIVGGATLMPSSAVEVPAPGCSMAAYSQPQDSYPPADCHYETDTVNDLVAAFEAALQTEAQARIEAERKVARQQAIIKRLRYKLQSR